MATTPENDKMWREYLHGNFQHEVVMRHFWRMIPANPRCRQCNAPFKGTGGAIARAVKGIRPSRRNPNYCNICDEFSRSHPGGAEIEMGFLFADIRGSTKLAESMSTEQFRGLINRFYNAANAVLVRSDAWIDKMVGDEVVAFYIPGFAGKDFAAKAVAAGRKLLEATGHGSPGGPWVPVGVGVNVGVAYMGTIGSEDTVSDITALGDPVNVTARLASAAKGGEVLVTDYAAGLAGIELEGVERRELDLKGKAELVGVRVFTV